ncbi:hypothetical protein J7E73_10280 [Paenibacillus albidus]|uniref:hypothetical protein n=1 Tax=Paenibacillus albidus TaxID=2041023 RepID=UPI001BE6A80F|nr:hypothetical protein [Paenibacillus albidus]MBT2289512.1 hypothetical protein [Paenibacillus albidus]
MEERVLDVEEMEQYVAKETNYPLFIVQTVLNTELDFLEEKGLVMDQRPEVEKGSTRIEEEDIIEYILARTIYSEVAIHSILEAEETYMLNAGLMSQKFEFTMP